MVSDSDEEETLSNDPTKWNPFLDAITPHQRLPLRLPFLKLLQNHLRNLISRNLHHVEEMSLGKGGKAEERLNLDERETSSFLQPCHPNIPKNLS